MSIMSSIKYFDLSPRVHTVQAFSGSDLFSLTEKKSYTLLPVSQSKPRAEPEPLAPNWFVSSGLALMSSTPVLASVKGCWRGLPANFLPANLWTYMHQLLLPKLVKVTLGGIFVKEFCYCCSWLHLELLRQAQAKDGNSGH